MRAVDNEIDERACGNPLIRCMREREEQLMGKPIENEERDLGALPPLTWFSMHLDATNAYNAMREEYYDISELWYSAKNHKTTGPYIQEPYGNGAQRKLAVNAQEIQMPYAGAGLYASEGPTKSSVFDFWALIYEKKITSIMSVNYPREERLNPSTHNEETETIQYWPFMEGQLMRFMPYTVVCLYSECKASTISGHSESSPSVISSGCGNGSMLVYRLSKLRVTYNNPILPSQLPLDVNHVCYYRWPDGRLPVPTEIHSIADSAVGLLEIVEQDLNWPHSPLLIHCHAGIGRTGALMAILLAIQQADDQHLVHVKDTVQELRKFRAKAVMNYWQYIFVYLTIAEVFVKRGHLDVSARHRLRQLWNELLADIPRQYN